MAHGRELPIPQLADAVGNEGQRRRLAREQRRVRTNNPSPQNFYNLEARLRPRRVPPAVQQHDQRRLRSARSAPAAAGPASVATARCAHRRLAGRAHQLVLRRADRVAVPTRRRRVPGVVDPAGLPRRQQLSTEHHRRGAGARRPAHAAELVQSRCGRHSDRSEPALRHRAAQRVPRTARSCRRTSPPRSGSRCRGAMAASSSAPRCSTSSTARTSARRTATQRCNAGTIAGIWIHAFMAEALRSADASQVRAQAEVTNARKHDSHSASVDAASRTLLPRGLSL